MWRIVERNPREKRESWNCDMSRRKPYVAFASTPAARARSSVSDTLLRLDHATQPWQQPASSSRPCLPTRAFVPAPAGWEGAKPGYCFRVGEHGLGYYLDIGLNNRLLLEGGKLKGPPSPGACTINRPLITMHD